jgi:hypothetical protein
VGLLIHRDLEVALADLRCISSVFKVLGRESLDVVVECSLEILSRERVLENVDG